MYIINVFYTCARAHTHTHARARVHTHAINI